MKDSLPDENGHQDKPTYPDYDSFSHGNVF